MPNFSRTSIDPVLLIDDAARSLAAFFNGVVVNMEEMI